MVLKNFSQTGWMGLSTPQFMFLHKLQDDRTHCSIISATPSYKNMNNTLKLIACAIHIRQIRIHDRAVSPGSYTLERATTGS